MATQTKTTTLRLFDDDPKALGVNHIQSIVCAEGLTEGLDFTVDKTPGNIRRLRPFGRELYTFTITYDDLSEQRAAEEAARQYALTQQADVQARWALHALKGKTPAEIYTLAQAEINSWSTLSQAKAGLTKWLPFMLAGLAWCVMEDK